MAPGGVYVLEDIHTSAQKQYDERPLTYNTSMMMIQRFELGQGIRSKHMTSSQIAYLERWLEGCVRVVPVGARSVLSMTCICWKRATPLPEGTPAPLPVDVAGRLYDLQAGEAWRSPKGGYLQVRSEKRCCDLAAKLQDGTFAAAEELAFKDCTWENAEAVELAKALPLAHRVTYLNIVGNPISARGFEAIGDAIRDGAAPHLRTLQFNIAKAASCHLWRECKRRGIKAVGVKTRQQPAKEC